jgi:phospholipid/cholesterol/gamma-HCH transport system substrate-binding protein
MKAGLTAGIFVVLAILIFTGGLFMIGDSHNLFSHHVEFYTEMSDVNGLANGLKVRVAGFPGGQVLRIELPGRPSGKFRIRMQLDDKLHALIRDDSVVTVETDGLVGDKFLLISEGTDKSQEAAPGATLASKEPVELSAVIAEASGVIDQAHNAIGDLQVKLDTALDSVNKTVNDTDGIIGDARNGKGSIGLLLNDKQTANRLKDTVANAQQASANIDQITVTAGQVMTDFQGRNLPAKVDDTIVTARHASQQIDLASQKVNTTLNAALGPDHSGEDGAENIRETLSNVNVATANMADDTEALKHEFFFRGFFKKRGFYSLRNLTADEYRSNSYFQSPENHRSWLDVNDTFTNDAKGNEILSAAGIRLLDQDIDNQKDSLSNEPMVVEGYAPDHQIATARSRALLVKLYLQKHYHLRDMDIALVPLGSIPPETSGKTSWNGACIVFLAGKK